MSALASPMTYGLARKGYIPTVLAQAARERQGRSIGERSYTASSDCPARPTAGALCTGLCVSAFVWSCGGACHAGDRVRRAMAFSWPVTGRQAVYTVSIRVVLDMLGSWSGATGGPRRRLVVRDAC
jgi:hypothetical protein